MGQAESTLPNDNRPRVGTNVFLNVYVPGPQAPNENGEAPKPQPQMSIPGFGIYHSGLQVLGTEYTFAGGDFDGCGVQEQVPKVTPTGSTWQFKETIDLGKTHLTDNEVRAVLSGIRASFPARSYNVMAKNCNHFTETLSVRLGVSHAYPAWVNRAAKIGNSFRGSGPDAVTQEKQRIEQEQMKQQAEAQAKATLGALQKQLKPEVPESCPIALEVQVNCPNGSKIKRRFLPSDTIADVMSVCLAFDLSLGALNTFSLRQNMPKKLFTDKKQTLSEAGFSKRENLFVEKVHK